MPGQSHAQWAVVYAFIALVTTLAAAFIAIVLL